VDKGEARLIFLGGMAEVGKNIFVVETRDDLVVIDFGLGFPDERHHGVDLVLPDIAYLREKREKIRGIFITHGHEDHIGALPFLWDEIRVPIHATLLTAGLIRGKLQEAGLDKKTEVRVFDPDERPTLGAGSVSIEPFRVTHSIPDAVGFGIDTPAGLVLHTSDFKFDPTPVDARPTDYGAIEAFGRRGVQLLISDCVHVETAGATPSESVIGDTYDEVFARAPGRIIVATFASLIARIQQVIDVASRYGRRVAPLGRSLARNVGIAQKLGYLHDPEGVLIDGRAAHELPEAQVVYVVTGSQGEPMAVLGRIANQEHPEIRVHNQDTVVISATPIPGNETSVYRIIDQLFHQGAEVIYSARARVHVSGHASRDELRRMIEMAQPKHVLPTHGEYRHLALYADLARETGIPDECIHMVGPGDVLSITRDRVTVTDRIQTGRIFVEGRTMNSVDDETLLERDQLANEGIITIAVPVDLAREHILGEPIISTVGLLLPLEDALREEMLMALTDSIGGMLETGVMVSERLEKRVVSIAASYLYREHRRRPMIQPMIIDVTGR
jgi:ribonuclease J